MLRVFVYLLVSVLFLSILRAVMSTILRGVAELFQPKANAKSARHAPISGELKKDPVCGTFISTATSIRKTVGGEVFYFCSTDCRDKYALNAP